MKQKMLYVSHVDWRWIKQRPHFIAEGLMAHLDVSVLYTFQNRGRDQLQKRKINEGDIRPLYYIPMSGRIKPLGVVNKFFIRTQLMHHIRRVKPEFLYLTYPNQIAYLPNQFKGKVIYDCMDDHIAMAPPSMKAKLENFERQMLCQADIVLVTSENLRHVLIQHYGGEYSEKMCLVRNGYSGKVLEIESNLSKNSEKFTIAYFGTIGKWFDFDLLLKSLDEFPNLSYKIIGPVETALSVPQHERMEFTGTVDHSKLYDAVKETDCLIMPFVVNDIVASVDPVKLYEYINFNKNILCVNYPEIQRFEPFVHFYHDYESYFSQIRSMMADNTIRYSAEAREQFLKANNWSNRVCTIVDILQKA